MDIRVGHGYDLHRLATPAEGGRPMVVGGVKIECPVGPISYSDGDAVMHAVADAILAATDHSDLGTLFPNSDEANEGRDSAEFLCKAIELVNEGDWAIGNIDITVLCDEPNIASYKEQICTSLRKLVGAPVNIKGKTLEGTERVKAIEVHAVALVQRGTHS